MIPSGILEPHLRARDKVDDVFKNEVMLFLFVRDPDKYRLLGSRHLTRLLEIKIAALFLDALRLSVQFGLRDINRRLFLLPHLYKDVFYIRQYLCIVVGQVLVSFRAMT